MINNVRKQELNDNLQLIKKNRRSKLRELKRNVKSVIKSSIDKTKEQLEVEKMYKKMSKHPPTHNILPYSSSKVIIPHEYNDAVANAKNEKQFQAAKEDRQRFVEQTLDSRIQQYTDHKRQIMVKSSTDTSSTSIVSSYPMKCADLFEESELAPSIVLLSPLQSRSTFDESAPMPRAHNSSPSADEDAMLMDYDRYIMSSQTSKDKVNACMDGGDIVSGASFSDSPVSVTSRNSLISVNTRVAVIDGTNSTKLLGHKMFEK